MAKLEELETDLAETVMDYVKYVSQASGVDNESACRDGVRAELIDLTEAVEDILNTYWRKDNGKEERE